MPGGYTYGAGIPVCDILRAVGLVNLLAVSGGGRECGWIDVETPVGDRPEAIFTAAAIAKGAPHVDT